jgi:hypothetical protein
VSYDHGSKNRLTARSLALFAGASLRDRLGRAVCAAGCLPRKELFEAWEVARRVRRHVRGGRVVDLAAGHGLLAYAMLLLDDSSAEAVCVDARRPSSATRIAAALEAEWPRLRGRVRYREQPLEAFPLEAGDVVVSAHACGGLTDVVLERAVAAGVPVAVLPCCQEAPAGELRGLDAWLSAPLATDVERAARLVRASYTVHAQHIPEDVTPKNRLLIGEPPMW